MEKCQSWDHSSKNSFFLNVRMKTVKFEEAVIIVWLYTSGNHSLHVQGRRSFDGMMENIEGSGVFTTAVYLVTWLVEDLRVFKILEKDHIRSLLLLSRQQFHCKTGSGSLCFHSNFMLFGGMWAVAEKWQKVVESPLTAGWNVSQVHSCTGSQVSSVRRKPHRDVPESPSTDKTCCTSCSFPQ